MARLIYALNQSLDGFVDHDRFSPDSILFRHFIEQVRNSAGSVYGRTMYEIMRYWDDDHPEWNDAERAYADVWRNQPKWVVSTTLSAVGPNATLISGDVEAALRDLKARIEGKIEIAGPMLASSLFGLGLIDEFQIYLHPAVLGSGKPFFLTAPPPLRLIDSERIGENAIRLSYVPA